MATANLGRVKPIYRGQYSPSFQYQLLDFLSHGSVLYICKSPSKGNIPTNELYFDAISDAGQAMPAPNRVPKANELGLLDHSWYGGAAVNQLTACILMAMDQASVANQSIKDLKGLSQQEGLTTITNRGIVSGCTVTKSDNATRNLNFSGGVVFMGGRKHAAPAADNAASVPPNTTASSVVVRAYLYLHAASQTMRLAVTNIGQALPQDAIHVYNITIPAGSTDATDPKLISATVSSVRRVEPMFPRSFASPVTKSVTINKLRDTEYRLDIDVVSFDGGACGIDQVVITSRATNGFSIYLASEVDNVVLRWRVSKLNN